MKRGAILGCLLLVACGDAAESASTDDLHGASHGLPQIPFLGGAVLVHPRLVTIVASNETFASDLFAYSDALTTSAWWKHAAEYGVKSFSSSVHVTASSPITTSPSNADLDAFVRDVIATRPSIAPDGSTIYLVHIPAGAAGCSDGGSHHPFDQSGDVVARVHRCVASHIPTIASHEIVESATNPSGDGYKLHTSSPIWSGSVWAARDGEVGDLCENEPTVVEGSDHFDRFWSNARAAKGQNPCVPADTGPFFDVSVASDWHEVAPGSSVSVKVKAWSTSSIAPWFISATIVPRRGSGTGTGFTAALSKTQVGSGDTVTLTVTAPTDAAPGAWALVEVRSAATPERHAWPVGFYVSPTIRN